MSSCPWLGWFVNSAGAMPPRLLCGQTRTIEPYAHLDNGVLLTAVNAAAHVTGTSWGDLA